jgi:ABC-type transport system involved in multi-copper enzyme maturation permease subunit
VNRVVIAETVRRHLTNVFFLAFLALVIIVSVAVSTFDRPGSGWPSLVSLLSLIAGCAVIGPEFSSGTLQLILVKPVNRAIYLLSRVAGVVAVVWLTSTVAALFELAGRAVWGETGVQAKAIGATLLNSATDTVLAVSLLALLGSLTRAYFNIGIYMVLMVGINVASVVFAFLRQTSNAVGRFLTEHTELERSLMVIEANLFPELPPRLSGTWTLMVLANAAVALLLACLAFRRREVPYGAD